MTLSPSFESLRSRIYPICVAIAAPQATQLFQTAEAELLESKFLELRLDALPSPHAASPGLHAFCAQHPEATVLATCRRTAGGGSFNGSVEEQLALLESFARSGAALVDLELESLQAAAGERLQRFGRELARAGAGLLVSAHDYAGTGDLPATLAQLRSLAAPAAPAAYKVVSTANSLGDTVSMLRFLEQNSAQVPIVGMCMGPAGLPSRVLNLRAGSLWTFAAASTGEETAPGQLPARLLRETFRAPELTPATQVYGVAGDPVEHSLSPAMHNAAFRAAGIDAVYLPLHTTSLDGLLSLARELPLAGFSVTMPWKVEILAYLDEVDPLAAAIGAVNTVVHRADGSLWGTNTDADAIAGPLAERLPLRDASVLLLGAGGASRAAAFALQRAGADVSIHNRTRPAAEQLARACGARIADPAKLRGFNVVVHATPSGMAGGASAHTLPIDLSDLEGTSVVFETVYRPVETPLVKAARALGIAVITGLEMFLRQGVRQWLLWTGRQKAPVGAMRQAIGMQPDEPGAAAPLEKEALHGKV